MNRLMNFGCVAVVVLGGLVGCKGRQSQGLQAPPPPDMQATQPAPFEPVQIQPQPSGPQAMPPGSYDPYGAPAAQGGNTYTVQKGDTIFGISRKVYGSNARARDIIAANPGINPDRINVGQVLVLPD